MYGAKTYGKGLNFWVHYLQWTIEAAVICILLYAVVYREAFEMATW